VKHFGDITKINGSDVPCVDIVVGGSPCQDLSIAGKREGLAGQRSGLFMEQIRIIKEMRENDRKIHPNVDLRHIRPRFMVWENVPGAFSSNKGEDFRAVLEETAHIADKDAVIPQPPKGKWTPSGCIMGDGWSIAWRVHDAQFWGVPQRRKRISLVADFGGGGRTRNTI
jgi:DNA (cytosine-5)-methyltransferase 1